MRPETRCPAVRLELQLEVTKEIQKDGGDIVITVTPTFIQELKLDLSTHGKLVWKHKFIFYWISDVYLEAGLNVYTYTAINLDATVVSQGEKDTVTKVKDLVNKLGKKLDALEGKDTGGEREEIDTSKLSLQELYNSMLELDSDWVELYRKQIFSMKKTVAKIIKFELTVDFVVELNIRMAMGMNFNYTNAKRYVFGVYLFKHRTTTRTYNLVNEQYNLRLYAMGAVGLQSRCGDMAERQSHIEEGGHSGHCGQIGRVLKRLWLCAVCCSTMRRGNPKPPMPRAR